MRNDVSGMGFGKLPPQARDFEEAVLGAMMVEQAALSEVSTFLTADMFYVEAHNSIFAAIIELHKVSAPIDLLTVTEQLKKVGKLELVGGPYYIAQLTNKIGSAANLEYHARIIFQKYIARQIISSSTNLIRDAYEDSFDSLELMDKWRADSIRLDALLNVGRNRDMSTITSEALDEILKSAQRKGLSKYPTFLSDFDANMSADAGDLIIVSGEAGMSKTSFVTDLGRRQAKKGLPFGFISGEMKDTSIAQRLIAQEGAIDLFKFARFGLDNREMMSKIYQAAEVVNKLPFYISESGGLKLSNIVSIARKWKKEHDIQGLGIDFLQAIKDSTVKTNSRAELIGYLAYAIKNLALELDIPIYLICTLNRDKANYGKRPILASLKESGDIEYAADKVIFLHRPEYFGELTDSSGGSTLNQCEAIIAKYRGGPMSTVILKFIKEFTKFYDYDGDGEYEVKQESRLTPMAEAKEKEGTNERIPF